MSAKSLEDMRNEERDHIMTLAKEHGIKLDPSDITFAENGRYPYIDDMDAEDWIQAMTME